MKCKIIINTLNYPDEGDSYMASSEIWSGELELLNEHEYLMKLSLIAEGKEHPLCDMPFGIDIGHWRWFNGNKEKDPPMYANLDIVSAYPDMHRRKWNINRLYGKRKRNALS